MKEAEGNHLLIDDLPVTALNQKPPWKVCQGKW